jgi:hypothetical protein
MCNAESMVKINVRVERNDHFYQAGSLFRVSGCEILWLSFVSFEMIVIFYSSSTVVTINAYIVAITKFLWHTERQKCFSMVGKLKQFFN